MSAYLQSNSSKEREKLLKTPLLSYGSGSGSAEPEEREEPGKQQQTYRYMMLDDREQIKDGEPKMSDSTDGAETKAKAEPKSSTQFEKKTKAEARDNNIRLRDLCHFRSLIPYLQKHGFMIKKWHVFRSYSNDIVNDIFEKTVVVTEKMAKDMGIPFEWNHCYEQINPLALAVYGLYNNYAKRAELTKYGPCKTQEFCTLKEEEYLYFEIIPALIKLCPLEKYINFLKTYPLKTDNRGYPPKEEPGNLVRDVFAKWKDDPGLSQTLLLLFLGKAGFSINNPGLLTNKFYVEVPRREAYPTHTLTILNAAIQSWAHWSIIKMLVVNYHADVKLKDGTGDTALMQYLHFRNPELSEMQFLIDAGADVNAIDIHGKTALMSIVGWQDLNDLGIAAVKLLLQNHANVDYADSQGNTALKLAERRANQKRNVIMVRENGEDEQRVEYSCTGNEAELVELLRAASQASKAMQVEDQQPTEFLPAYANQQQERANQHHIPSSKVVAVP